MRCQVCHSEELNHVISLGYMPPVNWMRPVGEEPGAETFMPTDLMHCSNCELVQLGYVGDPKIVFPPHYPYTSGSTRQLRENFDQLAEETVNGLGLEEDSHVVDIGSNDGTLLSAFAKRGMRVTGVEPTDIAIQANEDGIRTYKCFFDEAAAGRVIVDCGQADLVTCCNCFAHVPDVHGFVRGVKHLLKPGGMFVTESHYLVGLLEKTQYDTIYHEHLRYYSARSLRHLFGMHDMVIDTVKPIPTHGGSIRVYARSKGLENAELEKRIDMEPSGVKLRFMLGKFRQDVLRSRSMFQDRIYRARNRGRVVGIGAPSRASVVVSYCHLDSDIVDCVCELPGSRKIGRFMPGTNIPVVDEGVLYSQQPETAVVFSWHLYEEIARNVKKRGYRGQMMIPI